MLRIHFNLLSDIAHKNAQILNAIASLAAGPYLLEQVIAGHSLPQMQCQNME
jgi:hypothetical protein